MHFSSTLLPLILGTTLAVNARSLPKRCDDHNSTSGHSIDFTKFDASQDTVEEFLNNRQYKISNYTVGAGPGLIPHDFEKPNVDIVDGALTLLVKGQDDRRSISTAQIESFDKYTYGTLETIAKATPTPGVCQGIFFYDNDNAEVDIELLSSYYDEGTDVVTPGAQFTNQALKANQAPTSLAKDFGFDPTADFHNYTIRWSETKTEFWVDGNFQTAFTENVPRTASTIMYNNWSNGNPGWSAGPPRDAAIFSIKSFKYTPL
ncbi:hypothetical protein JCM16303_003837 [Sporobolomyces ruberrimus]